MREDTRARERAALREEYGRVRQWTAHLCEPLEIEDYVVQSMPDVSPTKWHLAHTTWFFETFLLARFLERYEPFDARYEVLFNSYYNSVGEQFPRDKRGLVTRPTVREVYAYREHVDEAMRALFLEMSEEHDTFWRVLELGLHHEQQHQELLLTDIKHVLSQSPGGPVYRERSTALTVFSREPTRFIEHDGGMVSIGATASDGFCFDNELPAHQAHVHPFALATSPVTVGEYLSFIKDGGYTRHELWLSQGWSWLDDEHIKAPLYWDLEALKDGEARAFTLSGARALLSDEIVTHLSMFEANAYARWAGARLPREEELEWALRQSSGARANFVDEELYHPGVPRQDERSPFLSIQGDVWEWTRSSYDAYPGYAPAPGALGEYNGKFMCNQYVLRGGSCATSRAHMRASYRNFFPSSARWQFSGVRLAKDRRS